MFYYLFFKKLIDIFSPFRVFRYIAFRSVYAIVTALLISLALGPFVIKKLQFLKFGQQIRDDGPDTHFTKAGTPSMGGLLILSAVFIAVALWARLDVSITFVLLFSIVWFGILGFLDDYAKVAKKRSLGLRGWHKIGLQAIGAFIIAYYMYRWAPDYYLGSTEGGTPEEIITPTTIFFPFFKNFHPDLKLLFIPFAMLVIIGASNAVNLTDGLDGLAIGCTMFVTVTFTALAHITSHQVAANYLYIAHFPLAGEAAVFCAALVGAGLGFLWFNAHPAKVFMGDTGSLSIGAALGTVAVLIKKEFLLPIVGGIFVAEALSVIIQVLSYKIWTRRVFRMSPLHHHFEKLKEPPDSLLKLDKPWPESKIVIRFWIIAAILVLITLSTLKLR